MYTVGTYTRVVRYRMKRFETDSCVYFVGRNARDNWDLLDRSEPHDLFVHAADTSSCYVIAVSRSRDPEDEGCFDQDDVRYACELCKSHTSSLEKSKSTSATNLLYTQVGNVQKGRVVGQVRLLKKPDIMRV